MEINTTHYLISFPQFLEQCAEALNTDKFQSKNYTMQKHCGGTETLYEAQTSFMGIEYTQTRVWRFHYNGTIGEGLTLEEATAEHKRKYEEVYYNR